jgi:Holliday junction resolvase RusA-like endonuclease
MKRTEWKVIVPGQPAGMPRARAVRTRFGVRHYTPKGAGSDFRARVAKAVANKPRLTGPVILTIWATFEIPKSWSKAKRANYDWTPHTQKPDADNVAKAVMDGMRGLWSDDCVVWNLRVVKAWGVLPRCTIVAESEGKHGEEDEGPKPAARVASSKNKRQRKPVHKPGAGTESTDRGQHRGSGTPNPWASDPQREGTEKPSNGAKRVTRKRRG